MCLSCQNVKRVSVALHPEGVDRNTQSCKSLYALCKVALHPEGVDRNNPSRTTTATKRLSPSTRRAWIEILKPTANCFATKVALHPEGVDRNGIKRNIVKVREHVALHPEGVDRNPNTGKSLTLTSGSPSTRRAWIEIL